ncbi:hypothetical protein Hanom_Chr16g01472871 [Helianthus anomalus]
MLSLDLMCICLKLVDIFMSLESCMIIGWSCVFNHDWLSVRCMILLFHS